MLTAICMAILALASIRAVFGNDFDDSLGQRAALTGICITSLGVAAWALKNDAPAALEWYAVAQAGFTIASILKRRR